jgi:hypothetical protein
MHLTRRTLLVTAGSLPLTSYFQTAATEEQPPVNNHPDTLLLSDFSGLEADVLAGAGWRGFSDRVMGGVSDASLNKATVDGKNCMRLTGRVTRESNGGFIQMAMYFGSNDAELDGSAYKGIEMLVHGNSIPWDDFKANGVKVALNSGRINRIAILGWMREFQADIALARISLYS